MTSKLNSLQEAGVEIANKLFKNGREIPKVPDIVMDTLKKTRIFTYERYYLIEIDPKFKQPLKLKVKEYINDLNKEMERSAVDLDKPQTTYE